MPRFFTSRDNIDKEKFTENYKFLLDILDKKFMIFFDHKSMLNYLKIFGKHVKVITPLSLKNKLKDFYKSAINE